MPDETRRPSLPPPVPRPAGAPLALDGIRILDFSRLLSGPYGTLLLADMGADVIKVENPATGDDSRMIQTPGAQGESALFHWANRNKRSVAIDLRQPEGQRLARELALKADVVVENFSTGVMERFGLGYEDLSALNPKLIYCSVCAFSREGPFAARPGYDTVIQAESGILSLSGFPDGEPVRCGAPLADISTGFMTANAILGALMARERHGIGQYCEVSLFDDAITMTGHLGVAYLLNGQEYQRCGNGSGTAEPSGLFKAQDGTVLITCANDKTFRLLAETMLGRPDIADDPRFANNRQRLAHKVELHAALNEELSSQPCKVWLEAGLRIGVPIGRVNSIGEAFNSEEVRSRGLLSEIPHPVLGKVPNVAAPLRFAGTPLADPVASPLLGAHTAEVLEEMLQLSQAEIEDLRKAGIFGATAAAG